MDKHLDDDQRKVLDIVRSARICMFTTVAEDGGLQSRPMAVQGKEFDGNLYFVSQAGNDVSQQIQANPQVNLAVAKDSAWVSIQGRASVAHDEAKLKELWSSANDAWTEGGPENPDNVLIAVAPDGAQYWESPGAPAMLVSMVKANLTGTKPKAGDTETVSF